MFVFRLGVFATTEDFYILISNDNFHVFIIAYFSMAWTQHKGTETLGSLLASIPVMKTWCLSEWTETMAPNDHCYNYSVSRLIQWDKSVPFFLILSFSCTIDLLEFSIFETFFLIVGFPKVTSMSIPSTTTIC